MTSAGSPKQCTIAYSVGRQYPVGEVVVFYGEQYVVRDVCPSTLVRDDYLYTLEPLDGGRELLSAYGSELEPIPEIRLLPPEVGDRVLVRYPLRVDGRQTYRDRPFLKGTVVISDHSNRHQWILVLLDDGMGSHWHYARDVGLL